MSVKKTESVPSRRDLLRRGLVGGVGTAVAAGGARVRRASAAGGEQEIRIGLIGCGKRGTGAVVNALKAGPGVRLVAMGDLFKDRLDESRQNLARKPEFAAQIDVPPERQFVGFGSLDKVLGTDCNYVILATPPGFRPQHLAAAVAAGKNVFTEKPMAVDAPGVRTCLEVAALADKKRLAIGVGLQLHHMRGYQETMKRVRQGMIGEIVGGRCYWAQGSLWVKPRQPSWTDAEWQIRNWLYFTWLSGDHIVEQHIHNIDIVTWAIGKAPVAAVAVGGRQQRTDPAYGHIYDHFAVDFEYPNGVHVQSMARQIPGCHNQISEHLVGTKGRADLSREGWAAYAHAGRHLFSHDGAKDVDPYTQEHIDLIQAIRQGRPYNELAKAAESNLAAIMGRMAAYTGKRVTWEQAMNARETLMPAELKFGALVVPPVPMPGTADVI